MTSTSAPAGESTTAARPRPVRRAPADLPFAFADRDLALALAAERGEPDWLRDERLAALAAFEALPVESNQLYTTYVDLRAARPRRRPAVGADGVGPASPAPGRISPTTSMPSSSFGRMPSSAWRCRRQPLRRA